MTVPIWYNIKIEGTDEEIAAESGLMLVGKMIHSMKLKKYLQTSKIKPQISDEDIIKTYAGLLSQGKTEYADIKLKEGTDFFKYMLQLKKLPSEEILRQRMDDAPESWVKGLGNACIDWLKMMNAEITPCLQDLIPLDIDVSPFDNSDTKKEGVSRTYAGYDGYAPIFAYYGNNEGYIVHQELREGHRHSQCDKGEFIRQAIRQAKIFKNSILIRMDSAHDSLDNLKICEKEGVEFIIKRNLRNEDRNYYYDRIKRSETAVVMEPRPGKTVFLDKMKADIGLKEEIWMVYEVTERTIDKKGNPNLLPDIEVNAYWTSLSNDPETVSRLYRERATSEQYHSEIKSEIGLVRFPSGKFKTNALVLAITSMVYNIIRWIGQTSRKYNYPGSKGKRRVRMKTVMQDIIYLAGKFVRHARQLVLKINRQSQFLPIFMKLNSMIPS